MIEATDVPVKQHYRQLLRFHRAGTCTVSALLVKVRLT